MQPRTLHEIAWPPSQVLKAAMETVAGGQGFDIAALEARLRDVPQVEAGGRIVSTRVWIEPRYCPSNVDLIPARFWAAFCGSGGQFRRYLIDGTPSTGQGGASPDSVLAPSDQARFSYSAEDARRHARQSSLALEDITTTFRNEWPGHLPFPHDVLSYRRGNDIMIFIEVEQDTSSPKVVKTSIYVRG